MKEKTRLWKKESFEIATKPKGTLKSVEGSVFNGFGIHFSHGGFVVTHLESGWAVTAFDAENKAKLCVEAIHEWDEWKVIKCEQEKLLELPVGLGVKLTKVIGELE